MTHRTKHSSKCNRVQIQNRMLSIRIQSTARPHPITSTWTTYTVNRWTQNVDETTTIREKWRDMSNGSTQNNKKKTDRGWRWYVRPEQTKSIAQIKSTYSPCWRIDVIQLSLPHKTLFIPWFIKDWPASMVSILDWKLDHSERRGFLICGDNCCYC